MNWLVKLTTKQPQPPVADYSRPLSPQNAEEKEFAFRSKEGFFFSWNAGQLTVCNAHPNYLGEMSEKEKTQCMAVYRQIAGLVDHQTQTIAIDPDLDETRWSGKLTADYQKIKQILASLLRYDPAIQSTYKVKFQSGFSRGLANREESDTYTVEELLKMPIVHPTAKRQTITLFHGTNSCLLANILAQGIQPSQTTGEKNWKGTEFRHHEFVIYLASDKSRALYYAEHSCEIWHTKGRLDAEPVLLQVTVSSDQLMADDDWLRKTYQGSGQQHVNEWYQSLTRFGQVACRGPILPQNIKVLQGRPTKPLQSPFSSFASGSENLSSALQTFFSNSRNRKLLPEVSKIILGYWSDDYYYVEALADLKQKPSDMNKLLEAVEEIEEWVWETDAERIAEEIRQNSRDEDQSLSQEEFEQAVEEAIETEQERLVVQRGQIAKELNDLTRQKN